MNNAQRNPGDVDPDERLHLIHVRVVFDDELDRKSVLTQVAKSAISIEKPKRMLMILGHSASASVLFQLVV
jgi:hypothetical protein